MRPYLEALASTLIHRSPQAIIDEIAALDAESAELLAGIRALPDPEKEQS
jgi:hypothetical protein